MTGGAAGLDLVADAFFEVVDFAFFFSSCCFFFSKSEARLDRRGAESERVEGILSSWVEFCRSSRERWRVSEGGKKRERREKRRDFEFELFFRNPNKLLSNSNEVHVLASDYDGDDYNDKFKREHREFTTS